MNKTYNIWRKAVRGVAKAGLCAVVAVGLTACGNLPSEDIATSASAAESAASTEEPSDAPSASASAEKGSKGNKRPESSAGSSASQGALSAGNVSVPSRTDLSERDKDASWSSSSPAIQLNGSSISVSGPGASADGSIATISQAGTYVVTGNLSDGRLVVDAGDSDDIQIVLNGADITSSDGPGIVVENADNVVITLADETENSVTDGDAYTDTSDSAPDAAVWSDCDLAINGGGRLTVKGNYNNGISTKDDLSVAEGTIVIDAANHGLKGKDSVSIAGGDFTITAGGDGIQSDQDDDPEKGWVVIDDGTFRIEAANDGIQGETGLVINDGSFDVTTGSGSSNGRVHTQENFGGRQGDFDPSAFGVPGDFGGWQGGFDPSQFDPSSDQGYGFGGHGGHGRPGTYGEASPDDAASDGAGRREPADFSSGEGPDAVTSPSITDNARTSQTAPGANMMTAAESGPRSGSPEETSETAAPETPRADSELEPSASESATARPTLPRRTETGSNNGIAGTGTAESMKGLKSGLDVALNGGTFSLDCADDAVHANNDLTIADAVLTISSGDDALHADGNLTISANIDITESYEGIEGAHVLIEEGTITVVSSDDGINAADDSGEWGTGCSVEIKGGSVNVQAGGDGIDSNGDITISGGETVVLISSTPDNGAIDAEGSFEITGGNVIYGGSGTGGAPQGSGISYVYASGSFPAGTTASVRSGGRDLMSAEITVDCTGLIFAGADITKGESYDVYSGNDLVSTVTTGEGAPAGMGGFGSRGGMKSGGMRPGAPADDASVQPSEPAESEASGETASPARPEKPAKPGSSSQETPAPTETAA